MDHFGPIPAIALDRRHPHFDERYIYAGTYAYTLSSKLLSEAEREKIIGSATIPELTEALRATFFGAYFAGSDDVEQAVVRAMVDARRTLQRLSPNPHLLSILWIRYDFYNLKVLMKRSRPEYGDASEDTFVPLGVHPYAALERAVKTGNGAALHDSLAAAIVSAPKNVDELDTFMEARYLEAALHEAEESDKPFAVRYIRILITLFSILSALRAHARGEAPVHIAVSDFSPRDIQNPDTMLTRLSHIGFARHWTAAIDAFKNHNDFSTLDRAADDFLMKWLKRQSIVLDSPAPLFSYWHVLRENTQLIRAALTARKVGMSETKLRDIIRTSYNSYVY